MKDVMVYGDYIGSVHFSAEDEVFYGKIEGVNDLVTFEGRNVDELKNSFTEAVENYISICREEGREMSRTYKGTFNVRISPELHRKAVWVASLNGISLNQLIQNAIEHEIERNGEITP